MTEENQDFSRRSVLKQAAAGGVGFVAAGAILSGLGSEQAHAAVEQVEARKEWLSQRASFLSGNKVLKPTEGGAILATTYARHIYRPRSAEEIAELLKESPATVPVASVCGGHESSNAALFASSEAIVLDLVHLKSITFHEDREGALVTVCSGVVFRELVEAVKGRRGALPLGTGSDVGVVGYIVNGGLSGYFSR